MKEMVKHRWVTLSGVHTVVPGGESAFLIGVKRLAGLYSFNLKEGVDQLIKIQRSIPSF